MKHATLALIILFILNASCAAPADPASASTSPTSSPAPITTFPDTTGVAAARARWDEVAQPDYVYVLNRGCTSCDQTLVGSFRITVRNGTAALVERVPTREVVIVEDAPTIDDLLVDVASHLSGQPDAEAVFDPDLGIPLRAELGTEDSVTIDFFSFDLAEQRKELELRRGRWVDQAISDYTFTWEQRCFCDEYEIGPFETSIVDGEVVETLWIGNSAGDVSAERPETVPLLFDVIERYLAMHPVRFEVSYHEQLDYPNSMYADVDLMIADEEYGFVVSGLEPASG